MSDRSGLKRQSSHEHLEFCNRLVRRSALKFPWDFNLQYNLHTYLGLVRPSDVVPVKLNSGVNEDAEDVVPSAPPMLCKRFWMKQPRID